MDEITLNDKVYVSTKKAAELVGYTNDYVGQMCREGRIEATRVGRSWYVKKASLLEHSDAQEKKDEDEHSVPVRRVPEGEVEDPGSAKVMIKERSAFLVKPKEPHISPNVTVAPFHYADKTIARYETDETSPMLPPLDTPRLHNVPETYKDKHPVPERLSPLHVLVGLTSFATAVVFVVGVLAGTVVDPTLGERISNYGEHFSIASVANAPSAVQTTAATFASFIDTTMYHYLYGDLF